jgi:hypothetical protein
LDKMGQSTDEFWATQAQPVVVGAFNREASLWDR